MSRLTLKAVTSAWIALALFTLPAAAQPPGTAEAEKAIRAEYVLTGRPSLKDDIAAQIAMSAPDFKVAFPGGKVITRSQWVLMAQEALVTLGPVVDVKIVIGKPVWQGGQAVFEVEQDMKATLNQGSVQHPIEQIQDSRDTWGLVGTVWEMHTSASLGERDYLDGKLQK